VTNDTYTGGQVRQHGPVSFSRVYDGGHAVSAYQPETLYRIFQRAMFGTDVATGTVEAGSDYSSEGPASSWRVEAKTFEPVENVCYTFVAGDTCTAEQQLALLDGSAVVDHYIVSSPQGTSLPASTPTGSSGASSETAQGTSSAGTVALGRDILLGVAAVATFFSMY
jgi:hypothetical protein